MNISYPVQFPCPTWSYGTDTVTYPIRTQFDNGWTRQRRAFPQTGMSANLTFLMTTVMFEKWNDWFAANGWDWFYIGLDNGEGTVQQEVRLMTPPTWGYDAYDNVVAQVVVEVSPEMSCREADSLCKQYACDSIFNFLDDNTRIYWDYTIGGPVPTVGNNDQIAATGFTWPFICSPLGIGNNIPEYPSGVGTCTTFDWAWSGSNSHQNETTLPGLGPGAGAEGYTYGIIVRISSGGWPSVALNFNDDFHPSPPHEFQIAIGESAGDVFYTHYGKTLRFPKQDGYHVLLMTYWRDPQWTVWSGSGAQETSELTAYFDGVQVGFADNMRTNDLGAGLACYINCDSGSLVVPFYDGTIWSPEKIAAFQDEFDRNFSDYVDPNCIEP